MSNSIPENTSYKQDDDLSRQKNKNIQSTTNQQTNNDVSFQFNAHNKSIVLRPQTLDEALQESSSIYYQIGLAIIVSITFNLSNCIKGGFAWLELKPQKAQCLIGNTFEQCNWDDACKSGQNYRVNHDSDRYLQNWMSQYNQWCLADYKVGLFGTTFFIGYVFGSLLFLALSDYIGRRKVVWLSLWAHAALLLLIVFTLTQSDFEYLIFIYLFLFGFKASMNAQVAYVLLSELVYVKYRPPLTSIVHGFDSFTNICIYLYFEYVRNWRYMIYFFSGLSIFFTVFYLMVPQSPRFFVARSQYENAHKQYDLMAKMSCKKRQRKMLVGQDQTQTLILSEIKVKKENFKDLVKAGRVAILPLFVITWFWFANNFVYYGLQVGVKYLKGTLFNNGLIIYGAVMLAMFSTGALANILGRRLSLVICYFLLLVGLISYLFVDNVDAGYVLLLIGMYGVAGAINIDYMVCSQLFPTSVRGVVFGIANTAARIGASISPLLEEILRDNTLYIYGGLGLISLVMVKLIRETKNQPLLTTLDDLQVLYGDPKEPQKSRILQESRVLREAADEDILSKSLMR